MDPDLSIIASRFLRLNILKLLHRYNVLINGRDLAGYTPLSITSSLMCSSLVDNMLKEDILEWLVAEGNARIFEDQIGEVHWRKTRIHNSLCYGLTSKMKTFVSEQLYSILPVDVTCIIKGYIQCHSISGLVVSNKYLEMV